MFLARIEGTLTLVAKHDTLSACRFLIGRRLPSDSALGDEPLLLLDRLGARHGSTVLVSTDGDAVRRLLGDTVPARLSVVGLVDAVSADPPPPGAQGTMR